MNIKMVINRSGLIAVIVGIISFIATGGEAGDIGSIVTLASSMTGAALILIREILS